MGEHCERAPGSKSGFTLLELLAVMVVIAMLFGMGSGIFSSIRVGSRGTTGLIKTMVRSTREQAVRSGLPARCYLNAEKGYAESVHFEDIGQWHFETPPSGGWSIDAEDAPPVEAGELWGYDSGTFIKPVVSSGRGVSEGGAPGGYLAFAAGGKLTIPIGDKNAFFTDRGFGLGLTLRLSGPASGRIASRSGSFELLLTRSGALQAQISLGAVDSADGPGRLAKVDTLLVKTPPEQIVPGVWTRIELMFDGLTGTLLVDGREAGREQYGSSMMLGLRESSDLRLCDGLDKAYDLDDVTLRRARVNGPVELPEGLRLSSMTIDGRATSHLQIFFTPEGYLDPRHHRQSVQIVFEEEGESEAATKRDTFRVGLLGILEDE